MRRAFTIAAALALAPPALGQEADSAEICDGGALHYPEAVNPLAWVDLELFVVNAKLLCEQDIAADAAFLRAMAAHYGCTQGSDFFEAAAAAISGPIPGMTDGADELRRDAPDLFAEICETVGRCGFPVFDPDAAPPDICPDEAWKTLFDPSALDVAQ